MSYKEWFSGFLLKFGAEILLPTGIKLYKNPGVALVGDFNQ